MIPKLLKQTMNCFTHMVGPQSMLQYNLTSTNLTVLVTGQLADDLQEVIHEIETLFGTLDEESLKLQ